MNVALVQVVGGGAACLQLSWSFFMAVAGHLSAYNGPCTTGPHEQMQAVDHAAVEPTGLSSCDRLC
jgi:hypothetical protein